MPVKHHLNDSLLMAYSAGNLPEAFNLVVASHISLCDDCRARMESFDAVGGALLEGSDFIEMDDQALDAVMARIERPDVGPDAETQTHDRNKDAVLPAPLRDYVGGDLSAVKWRAAGGGVRQAILPTAKGATVRLIYIPAGSSVPDHGHNGTELTLVLQGAFRDDHDHFARGDIEIADEELQHTPVAEEGLPCICLAATDAPLKFNALLPRLAQRFLRI